MTARHILFDTILPWGALTASLAFVAMIVFSN